MPNINTLERCPGPMNILIQACYVQSNYGHTNRSDTLICVTRLYCVSKYPREIEIAAHVTLEIKTSESNGERYELRDMI